MNTAQLCATNRIALNATFAILDSATLLYTYISRFSVNPNYQQREKIRRSCRHKFYSPTVSHPAFQLRSQTALVRFHGRKCVHTRLSAKDRTQGLTRRNRGLPDRAAITTLGAFRTFTNIPGPGVRTAHFADFGSWSGVLQKDTESLRNSDAHKRVAIPRRRGPAGLRDPFFASVEIVACIPWAQCFPHVRDEGWYHYPRCALRVVEMPDGRLSKRLIFRFLVSPIYICERPCRVLPISALIQIDCCWISCGHTACPWLIQA